MALDQDQKIFIKAKVEELGSLKAVQSFYKSDCLVVRYAHKIALELYDKEGRER